MFFKRSIIIKLKNYLIICYIFFLLFHGTNRCIRTKTFSVLYDYFYYYLTNENFYKKQNINFFTLHSNKFIIGSGGASTNFIENKNYIYQNQNIFIIKKVCIWCNRFKITIVNFYNILKTMYAYNVIFSYFYTNNLKTDIITIKNDIEICYNNLLIPLFWIVLILIRRI